MNYPYKVLYAEDDIVDRRAFERYVANEAQNYSFVYAKSLSEAYHYFNHEDFDLIVSDYHLGDGEIDELLIDATMKNIPTIVITGAGDELTAVRLLKSGASDYIIKDQERNYLKIISTAANAALERKRQESLIYKLSQIAELSPGMLVLFNVQGEIEYANPKFLDTMGYEHKEILGTSIEILIPSDRYPIIWEALKRGARWQGELSNCTKTGEMFWEHAVFSPIYNKKGKIINYMKVSENLTFQIHSPLHRLETLNVDELTGHHNRNACMLLLEEHIKQCYREKHKLSIGYFDIDELREVNNKYGYHEGDELIKATADILHKAIRTSDILCRVEGDEFLVIFPKCGQEYAHGVWSRIDHIFQNCTKCKNFEARLSFACVEYPMDKFLNAEDFLALAQSQLYIQKTVAKLEKQNKEN